MTSKPEMKYGGVTKDVTEPSPYQNTQSKSAHIVLSLVLTPRGTDKPTFVDAIGFNATYGTGALDSHEHFVHQSKYLQTQLQGNGHAVVKRITLPGAAKAMTRVSLEIIPANIPIYKVDDDWRRVYEYFEDTGASKPIVLGYRKGYRAIIHIGTGLYPTQVRGFRMGTVSNYRLGKTIGFDGTRLDGGTGNGDGETSKLYPLFDLELADHGEFGNNVTMSVTEFIDTVTPYDAAMSNLVIREAGTPMVNSDGIAETAFSLAPVGDANYSLGRAIQNAFAGGYNSLIGRVHTYDAEIAAVSKMLALGDMGHGIVGETSLIISTKELNNNPNLGWPDQNISESNGAYPFTFNILTGRNNTGIQFINGDLAHGDNFGGSLLTEGELHAFTGGSDGYPYTEAGELDKLQQLRLYDEAVRAELKSMAGENSQYINIARFPHTVWYDSGYSMDTKLAAFNILKHRPEVTVIMSPHSVAEYGAEINVPVVPEINCTGATNNTGILELTGKFDVYLGKTKVGDDMSVEHVKAYLEGTGNFAVTEDLT